MNLIYICLYNVDRLVLYAAKALLINIIFRHIYKHFGFLMKSGIILYLSNGPEVIINQKKTYRLTSAGIWSFKGHYNLAISLTTLKCNT